MLSDDNKDLGHKVKDRGHKAKDSNIKANDLGHKAKAKDLICQGQWQNNKTKANNDHKMMMMNKIFVKQENSRSYW